MKDKLKTILKIMIENRKQWFIDRIGKRVYRGQTSCQCETCKRISKEGQRIYVSRENIRSVKNGVGIAILSTSKGVVTGEEARKNGVGGELICEVW